MIPEGHARLDWTASGNASPPLPIAGGGEVEEAFLPVLMGTSGQGSSGTLPGGKCGSWGQKVWSFAGTERNLALRPA